MQNLMTTDNLLVVIDLGTSKIRGVVGRKDESGNVEVIAYEELSSKTSHLGMKRGSVFNLTEAAFCIKELLTKLQNDVNLIFNEGRPEEDRKTFEINGVYVGLNGKTIKSVDNRVRRILGNVEITQEIVDALHAENNNLKIDGHEILKVVVQEHFVDDESVHNMVGCRCTQQLEGRYKIIAGDPLLKNNLIRCFEKVNESFERTGSGCKVEILDVFLSPIATASAVLSHEEKKLGCAMIDFGAGTTSIAVYQENVLRHVCVLPFGGDTITTDITYLKVLKDMAEKIKIQCGSTKKELIEEYEIVIPSTVQDKEAKKLSSKFLAEIIEARVDEILKHVCVYLDKYAYYIDGIVITGGGSKLKHLIEKLKLHTGLDVRIGIPSQKKSPNMAECYLNVACAQLIGLLIHAEKPGVREKKTADAKAEGDTEVKEKPIVKRQKTIKERWDIWKGGLFGKLDEMFEEEKFEEDEK